MHDIFLQVWPVVHQTLNAKGLKSVTPVEANKLMKQGWKLVRAGLVLYI